MTSIRTAPCEWPIAGSDDCDALAASGIGQVVKEAAVAFLWNWTGRIYGLCETTVRPCRRDCLEGATTFRGGAGDPMPSAGGSPFTPALVGGVWRNIACGRCGPSCSCTSVESIRLPGPVDSIVEVMIDGEALDPAAYRVDNRRRLVRDDGGDWPVCQDLSQPDGEDGTWSVTYRWGVPVPAGGQVAAGVLACELAKAATRDPGCKLPVRVQTITREGVTVGVLLDQFEDLRKGRTGLWLVDSWVTSVSAAPKRSAVIVPTSRGPATTTFRGGS